MQRGTLRYFELGNPRLTEGFATNEVTVYVEAMINVVRSVQNKKPTAEVIFDSPPGQPYLSKVLQVSRFDDEVSICK